MFGRILKKDFLRNRIITITLFAFIMLAALLVSGAAGIIIELSGAMDTLLEKSNAANFAQMHTGEIDQESLDNFAAENSGLIKGQQTVKLLNINGANIFLGYNEASEADSVMENAFVTQNEYFDFLLDMDNEILQVKDGEVAVPLYHMQQYGLKVGDPVRIVSGEFEMEFTIAAFLRDSLMNPSLVNSKRFLISANDWNLLNATLGEIEYVIEVQVTDLSRVSEFENLYQNSGLPQKGAIMTNSLVKVINAMSDGISAAVIILIGILLVVIAALCLRFTMMATIEEDYREIGVMKAIGIHSKDIRKLYLTKYIVMSAAASICGYVSSLFVGQLFTANISLYMGNAEQTIWNTLLPLVGAGLVFVAVVAFCSLVLRKFKAISAVEAMRTGNSPDRGRNQRSLKLHKSNFPNVNIFLGIREVLSRFRVYGLLCFIFLICTFLMIVPINFLNTLESPEFVTYMGAGQCDIRVDLQQTADIEQRYADMVNYIENDPDVKKYAALFTSIYKVLNSDGGYENIKIEVGDFEVFPLEYTSGTAPKIENEIALSAMNADEMNKRVGDTLVVMVDGQPRELNICGIYQDVTNGGRTAKAVLPYNADNIIWFTLNLNVQDGVSIPEKIEEYSNTFYPAKVTDVDNYIYQTMRSIIDQLKLVVKFAFVLALAITVLITAMFFKMLIAKEASGIAIMRSLGLSYRDIRLQYVTRAIIVLLIGIVAGSIAAVTLGQGLAGMLISGVSGMRFIISPLMSFIVCPLALAAAVGVTIFCGSTSIRKINIMLVAE